MNAEAQRIACAELCGWKFDAPPQFGHNQKWNILPYKDEPLFDAQHSAWAGEPKNPVVEIDGWIPDYLNDANTHPELLRVIEERGLVNAFVNAIAHVRSYTNSPLGNIWIGVSLTQPQFVECVLRACGAWKEGE